MQFSNEQAMKVVDAAWGHSPEAQAQALQWAADVARANARAVFSEWTGADWFSVFHGAGPDLCAALGHCTPANYLSDDK